MSKHFIIQKIPCLFITHFVMMLYNGNMRVLKVIFAVQKMRLKNMCLYMYYTYVNVCLYLFYIDP